MYANLSFIDQVETARRHQAEREAAHWRLARALLRSSQRESKLRGLWQRFGLLARIRDRQVLRARLKRYAARS